MDDLKSKERFSNRVSDYVKYRPSYPGELLDLLDTRVPLAKAIVADVGSGTGIFSKQLFDRGAKVFAIEPNAKMRAESVGVGADLIDGTAEATKLADHSVDLITCAQAFHWFDPRKTRIEFQRILRPRGLVALMWNDLVCTEGAGLEYERIRNSFGLSQLREQIYGGKTLDHAMDILFGGGYESHYFSFSQDLTQEALRGRYFSSSYSPSVESKHRPAAETAIAELFNAFQSGGEVRLEYKTELFLGELGK